MAITWGPRGYPGNQGLKGNTGQKGDKGDAGQGVTLTNNGDGTYTITGANGSIILRDGKTPVYGVDYFSGKSGDYTSTVYGNVPNGSPVPSITNGTGVYDGTNEVMPTGSVSWTKTPVYQEGYTTYLSSNRYINTVTNTGVSTWDLASPVWASPTVYKINETSDLKFVSYCFTRSDTQPSIPTGGSYLSPVPTTINWNDGIPSGTKPVWSSKRLFTESGAYPQSNSWSYPVKMANDGMGTKFMFGVTSTGPWHDTPQVSDMYMIKCTNTGHGGWYCDTLNPIKIKGEAGANKSKYLATAFKRSNDDLTTIAGGEAERPEGGTFDAPWPVDSLAVEGWTKGIPEGTANIYTSNRIFTADGEPPQESLWSPAQLFSGGNATSFVLSADSNTFAYEKDSSNTVIITPNSITFKVVQENIDKDIVWTTSPDINSTIADMDHGGEPNNSPILIITNNEFDLAGVNVLKVTASTTDGSHSDTTSIIKVQDGHNPQPGVDYNDGKGVFKSTVYVLSKGIPATPTGGSWDGVVEDEPSGNVNYVANPGDLPVTVNTKWDDDPVGSINGMEVWQSSFTFISSGDANDPWGENSTQPNGGVNGTGPGGPWSTPTKYSYIPEEGIDYFTENTFLSYIFKTVKSGEAVSVPATGYETVTSGYYTEANKEYVPDGWNDDPISPQDDEIVWVCSRTYKRDTSSSDPENHKWPADAWSTPSRFSGTSGVTGVLDNEIATASADYTGIVAPATLTNITGNFLVYHGTKDVTSSCTFKLESQSGSTSTTSYRNQSGLRCTIDKSDGFYGLSNNGSNSWLGSDKEIFVLVATYPMTDGPDITVKKKFTVNKVKDGVSGSATRVDIAYANNASGTNASYPNLYFDGQNNRVYVKATPSSDRKYMGTNAVSWTPENDPPWDGEKAVSGSPGDYEWTKIAGDSGADGDNGLSTRLDIAYADNYAGGAASGNLRFKFNPQTPAVPAATSRYIGTNVVTWDSSTSEPPVVKSAGGAHNTAYEWTKYKGEDGSDGVDGTDGQNAINIVLSNGNHTIPSRNNGSTNSADFLFSATTVKVYEGTTLLTRASTLTAGTWKITGISNTNVTGPTTSSTDLVDKITAFSSTHLVGSRTITISGKTAKNESFTMQATQSLTKSIAGQDGGGSEFIETASSGKATNNGTPQTSVTHVSGGNDIVIEWMLNITTNSNPGTATVGLAKYNSSTSSWVYVTSESVTPTVSGALWRVNTGLKRFIVDSPTVGSHMYRVYTLSVNSASAIKDSGYLTTKEIR